MTTTTVTSELEWVRPPQQARSQKTLERILDAAEALISDKGLENTTVSEIAKTARSSVGSIYARFPDKEALLRTLFERFASQAEATVDAVLEPRRWEGVAVGDIVHSAVAFMLRIFRERRWLIAAFTLRAARDPGLSRFGEGIGTRVAERVHALLAERGVAVDHPDPRAAVEFAVWLVLSALEARTLYRSELAAAIPEETIAAEMTRMCMAYLGVADHEIAPRSHERGEHGPDAVPQEPPSL